MKKINCDDVMIVNLNNYKVIAWASNLRTLIWGVTGPNYLTSQSMFIRAKQGLFSLSAS